MAGKETSSSTSSISRTSSDSNLSAKLSDSDFQIGAVGGDNSKMATVCDEKSVDTCPVEDSIQKLLEKQRSEIMYELRRLKMGDRPVTGQENKTTVENFFNKRLNPTSEPAASGEHRPEAVLVEVQGLVQTRPVSSILQSAQFRRTLENAIRGGLSSLSRVVPPPIARPRNTRPESPRNQTESHDSVPVPPPAPPLDPNMLEDIRQRLETGPQLVRPPLLPAAVRARLRERGQVESPATNDRASEQNSQRPILAPEVPGPERANSWLQQVPAPREQQRMSVWENIEQVQREDIIMEISELVQAQLVTQTLGGQFRNTLERRMRDHLDSSGTDGSRVQAFLQTLPQSAHVRNDFSDLGIQGPNQQGAAASLSDGLDNISVISATAAVQVQQTQQQTVFNRELQSLKAQMQEMKNMLKLSFDMQLDIQRAIRQEVAAAIAANLGPHTEPPPPRAARPVDDTHCLICLDATADSVLYQCGHLCLCYTCGLRLRSRDANCPVCRAPIKDIMRVYKTGHTN